ncbi:MAG: VRR-NUC domain-containing protein [Burkholderiaceae bacterium]
MAPSEHQIQSSYFDWARQHPLARRAYAIPNGGKRNLVVAMKLKAEGVRPGVLDVCLPIPCGGAAGLYIEFKAGRNGLTDEQATEADTLVRDGYAVAVCWDAGDAIEVTRQYLAGDLGPCLMLMKRTSGSRRIARPLARDRTGCTGTLAAS